MIRLLLTFLGDVFKFIWEALVLAYHLIQSPRDHDYHAEFGDGWPVLSRFHEGVNISGQMRISKEFSTRHTLITGVSGSGKSTIVWFNSLLSMHDANASFVINDPSKELWKCAAFLKSRGIEPMILDFSSANSIGFNPILKIQEEQDIQKLASMIIKTTLQFKEPFWDSVGLETLSMCIALIKKLEPQFRHLANTKRLVQMLASDKERIKTLMIKHSSDKTFAMFKNFLSYDEKLRKNIVATTNSALVMFESEDIARVTSTDTLDFSALRKKPIALFIHNRITDQKYYNILISIFFETLFTTLMREPVRPGDRTVYFFIDEAASGLYLPSLGNVLVNSRKSLMPFVLGIQDPAQLTDTYNREVANTILSNCYNKLFLSGASLDTCRMLESMLERYTYKEGKSKHTRSLMTAAEIRQMPSDRGIFIAGNHAPVYLKLHPYYKISTYRKRSSLPLHVFSAPPLPPVTYIK